MSNWNPLGNHVQNGRSDPEHVHVERAKVGKFTTSSALDSFGLADQWQKNGMCFPIYRDYNLEPSANGKYNTAQKVYDEIQRVGRQNPSVYWNISCEVDMTDWLYQLYIDLMDLLAKDSQVIGVVMSNAAYLPSWWDTDKGGNHYERPMAKKYLQKLWDLRHVKNPSGHPAFIHGDHVYTAGFWNAFANGGAFLNDPQSAFSPKWDTGEYHIDWSVPNWHFNKIQGIKDALGWRWDNTKREWVAKPGVSPTADLPWMIITEELFGSMSVEALLKAYPNWVNTPPWNRDIRGYRANTNQWQEWYKQPAGLVLTKMRGMMWKHVYRGLKTVLGTTHFAAGNTGGPWDADNTTGDQDYNESVVNIRLEVPYFDGITTPPPPDPAPNPAPDDPRFAPYTVTTVASGGANVRARPSTDAGIVGSIPGGGAEIGHIPYDSLTTAEKALARPGDGFEWYCVRVVRSGKQYAGWTRADVISKPVPVVVEPPPDDTARQLLEDWIAREKGQLVELNLLIDRLNTAKESALALRATCVENLTDLERKLEETQ